VAVICSDDSTTALRTRNRLEKHFTAALVRVFKFAEHETLRKLQRYMHSHRPIMGAEEPLDHPDTLRIVFSVDELRKDLSEMLATELPLTLNIAATDTLAAIGSRDPFQMAAQPTLDFIARRQNFLSKIPDEIWEVIRGEISEGLYAGEPLRDISARITKAFDFIETERATLIARTETSSAYAFASHSAAVAAGVTHKKWVHSVIPIVPRPDHLAIDGLIVPIDQPFPVGDPQLMYPHDGNGSAEDVINCRCISVPTSEAAYKAQQNGG
jgi:hypothetical protein